MPEDRPARAVTSWHPGRLKITAPVLILGGRNSPPWFQRSVAEQAAATPGAQLRMLDGFDRNAPVEVIAPILTGLFGAFAHGVI